MKTFLKIFLIVSTLALAVQTQAAPFGWNSFKLGLAKPYPIGSITPNTGAFTTLTASSTNSLGLGTAGSAVGQIKFYNATSGGITLQPVTGALGTPTLLLGTTFTNTKYCTYSTTTGLTCAAEGGAGASISGTPAQYQWGEWVNATTIKGTAVTASKVVCTDANGSPTACTNSFTFPAIAAAGDVIVGSGAGAATVITKGANSSIFGVDSDGNLGFYSSISPKFVEVDGHTDSTNLTAANVSRTFINSYDRAGAATLTLPAAAAGYSFVAIVGTQHNSLWKIQRAGSDTIYWDSGGTLTAGKTYFGETNQAVGSRVSCSTFRTGASAYSWLCGVVSGTWTTD